MTANVAAFDHWIRGPFATLNTALEDLYFASTDRSDDIPSRYRDIEALRGSL
jgi:hypothetical protein